MGFKSRKIKESYPTREEAIAQTYSMISGIVESLSVDLHPELRAAIVKGLVKVGESQIEIIKEAEAWD